MMKKTIFFMLCLAPVGAWAEPFTGGLVTNTTFEDGIDVSAMYIGTTVEDNSALFTGPDINQENYTLTTKGDISVEGLLSIADGYVLNLQNFFLHVLFFFGKVLSPLLKVYFF